MHLTTLRERDDIPAEPQKVKVWGCPVKRYSKESLLPNYGLHDSLNLKSSYISLFLY